MKWKYLIVLGFVFVFSGSLWAGNQLSTIESQIDALVLEIQEQHTLNIVYKDIPRSIWTKAVYYPAERADYVELLKYLKLFKEEIAKYPKSFFEKSKLRKVFVVKKFFYKEHLAEGFYRPQDQVIFLDFLRSRGNTLGQRHNIHHEFFHMIDFLMTGKPPAWEDSVWLSFNDKDFAYDQKGFFQERLPNKKDTNLREMIFFDQPKAGFMTDYSMTAVSEDKAEIFACLMVESQNKILKRWIEAGDKVLQKKVDYLKDFVAWYCGETSGEYWDNLF